jgi:hypothetical protein
MSLHQHTYNCFFLGVFLLSFLRVVHRDGGAVRSAIVCWLALFLTSMTSFEFILYAQVFAWVYVLAAGRFREHWRLLVVMATAPIAGIALHFLQVVWALGWSEALADNLGFNHIRGGLAGLQDRWQTLKDVPAFVQEQSQHLYFWPAQAILLAAIMWLVLSSREQPGTITARRSGALLVALAIASLTWFAAMPYHTVRHPHTMGQLLPLVFVAMGGTIALIARWLFGPGTPVHQRCLAALVMVVVLFGQVQTLLPASKGQSDGLAILAEAIGPDAFPPRVGILSNAGFPAQCGYFLRRPWWLVPNNDAIPPVPFPDALPKLQRHLAPDWQIQYYLFATWGDRSPFATLAAACPGRKLALPGGRDFLVLFDISSLHLPPGKRPPLDPQVREGQLRGDFPDWQIPGFGERWANLTQER